MANQEAMREYAKMFAARGTSVQRRLLYGGQPSAAESSMHMEITVPELKRVMVTVPGELDARQQQALEEETLLGYSAYRKELGLPGPLARTLAALEIEHLDTESVVQYKYAMMSKESQKLNPSGRNRRDVFFDMKSCSLPDLHRVKFNSDATMFMDSFVPSHGLMGIDRGSVTLVRWVCTSLRGYTQAVPDFARSKALQIKRACPEAELFVEELRQNQVLIDPFLIARLDDEQFYIEVWGEPEFESQMEHNQV